MPYICLFALAGCLSACTGSVEKNETEDLLSRAESVMEQYPDSALAILDTVSRQMLHGREQTARYSLLYSQALEKNDILLETDSVIAPAVRYYRHHGTADERLLTQYYSGCIHWNAGDLDEALECFLHGGRYADKASDHQAVGRLHAYIRTVTDIHDIEWGLVSRVYLLAGKTDSARVALDNYEVAFPDYQESIQYHPLAELSQRILDSSNGLVVFVVNVL